METDIFFNFSFISIVRFSTNKSKVIWYSAKTRLSVDQSSCSKDDSDAANGIVSITWLQHHNNSRQRRYTDLVAPGDNSGTAMYSAYSPTEIFATQWHLINFICGSPEFSTGRMDPRVGSGSVGSRFCRIQLGQHFGNFSDYFWVPESMWIFEYCIWIYGFSTIFN